MPRTLERRVFPLHDVQIIRASDKTGSLKFRGRPWVYGQLSEDMGGWQEVIDPGAATRTLAADPDVRFLVNHDANLLLARTSSGTLRLSEDDEGGWADADMADVSYARDLAALIDRGDLSQMSFAFWITNDMWSGNLHRVREFDLDGGDVSAVTFPAFPQTSADLRAAAARAIGHEPTVDLRSVDLAGVLATVAAAEPQERQAALAAAASALRAAGGPALIGEAAEALAALQEPSGGEAASGGYPLERALHRLRELEILSAL